MSELSPGQQHIQDMQDGGATDTTIAAMKAQKSQVFMSNGYSQREIDDYWGDTPKEPAPVTGQVMANNLDKAKQDGHWDPAKLPLSDPNSWYKSFTTGLSYGSTPLNYGHVPSFQLDQKNMGFGSKLAASVGGLIGDANEMVAGGLTTALVTGNPMAAWAAGSALPAAIRSSAMYDLQHGHPANWNDVATKGLQVTEDASKAAVVGGLTYGAAKFAGPVAEAAGGAVKNVLAPSVAKVAAPVAKTAVEASAMGAAATTVASAVQGKLPSADDFLVATTMFAAIPAGRLIWGTVKPSDISSSVGATGRTVLTQSGKNIEKNLQTLYAKTGIAPVDAVRIASNSPWLKQTLTSNNADGEMNTKGWEEHAPPTPTTVKPQEEKPVGPEGKVTTENPTEPEPVKPLETVGMPSARTGIPSIKSVSPDDLGSILKAADTETKSPVVDLANKVADQPGDQMNDDGAKSPTDLAELANKYKNKDGSTDLESILIDHHAGEAEALLYRANGRDFSALPVPTQHYLESVGAILDKGGYAPEAPEEAATGGSDGKPPATPPVGEAASEGGKLVTTGGSGGKPPTIPPSGEPPVEEGPVGRNWADAMVSMNKDIQPAVKGGAFTDIWRRVKGMWRELSPAAEQDKALGVKGDPDAHAAGMEDMLRSVYGATGRAIMRIREGGYTRGVDENGNIKYTINRDVPSWEKVMADAKKLPGGGLYGFRAFGMAKNALDLEALGKKSTTDPIQARADLDAMPAKVRDQYEKVWADYQKVKNDVMQGAVASGMKSQEQVDAMQAARPNHFPQVAATDEAGASAGGKGSIFAPAKGHEYKVVDPIFTDVMRMAKLEQVYSVNTARQFVVNTLKGVLGGDVEVSADQKDPLQIEGNGDDKAIADIGGDPKFFERNDQNINYWEDGVHKTYTVPNFPGREMFMRMMNGSTTAFEHNWGTNFLQSFAKVQRTAIAESLNFVGRIMFQDSLQAAQFSKYGGVPVANTVRGAFALLDNAMNEGDATKPGVGHEKVTEYILNGGYSMALSSMDTHGVLGEWNRMEAEGTFGAVTNMVKSPLEGLLKASQSMDAATRIGGPYTSARAAGLGPMMSAMEARQVHGDFAEKSLDPIVNWLTSVSPFMRATMRGKVDAFTRAVSQDPVGFAARALKMGVYFSMTNIALHYGLEKMYEKTGNVPEDMKMENQPLSARFGTYQLPFMDSHGNYSIAKLPVPFDVGFFINGTVQTFMSQWLDKDPITAKEYISAMWDKMSTTPVPVYDNIAAKTIVDHTTNFNMGTGRPVIPASMEKLHGYEQAYPWTSETAKSVSNLLGPRMSNMANVSPIYIDKFVGDMAGDTGTSLLRLVDGAVKDSPLPSDWANTPFIGGYFLRHPQLSALPMQRFEAKYQEYVKTKGDYKAMLKTGDTDGAAALEDTLNAGSGLEQAHKAISNARGVIAGIENNKDMSTQDKRQNIDTLVDNMLLSVKDKLAQMKDQ